MGRITTFEEQVRNPSGVMRVQVAPQDTGAGALAAGLQGISQAAGRAANMSAELDLATQRAARTQRLQEVRTQALGELTDLRLKFARDADPATMQQRWQAESDQILQRYVQGFGTDKGLVQSFSNDFEQWRLRDKVEIAGQAAGTLAKQGRAKLDAGLDTLAGMLAQTDDEIRTRQIQDMAALSINDAVTAGYLDPVEAGEMGRKFIGRADEAKARGLIIDNPEAALSALRDPKNFAGLDEIKRTTLTDMATRRVDSLRSDRVRLLEHQDRLAEKALEKQSDDTAKRLWHLDASGALTRDDIESQRGVLKVGEYKALLASLQQDNAAVDDVETVADLTNRVGSEDIAAAATDAFKSGRIKKETFTSLIEKNRTLRADNAPDTPYKSARELVSITLDPGSLLSGPAANIARAGRAQGLAEFDNWAAAHPGATRAEAQAEAQNTIRRYQVINYDQMSLATGLPRFYPGQRNELTAADLDAAEAQTLAVLDGGGLTREQADQELRKIETWRQILAQKPPSTGK